MTIRATPRKKHRVAKDGPYADFARSFPDYTDYLIKSRRSFHAACSQLREQHPRSQHHSVRRLLRKRAYYPIYAFDALKACDRLAGLTPAKINDLAEAFDPFNSIDDERALVRNVSPTATRQRLVCDFGPKRRMHQQVVDRILRNLHPPLGNQYLFNGGMPMALSAIEAAVSDGHIYACELDFVDFYGSVRFADMAEVMRPLPSSVTSHVVWDFALRRRDLFTYSSSMLPTPTPEAPNGLLLGSALSSIVGEVLIARLLEAAQLPGVITYADNLLVLGRNEEEVDARKHELQRVLRDPPFACVSGLRLQERETRNLAVAGWRQSIFGIEFAGHRSAHAPEEIADLLEPNPEGRPIIGWQPAPEKLAQFQISAADYVTVEQINRAIPKVSNWRRYYASWPDGDMYESEYLAALTARRFMLASSPEHKASAVAALVDAFLLHADRKTIIGGVNQFLPGLGGTAEKELRETVIARLQAIAIAIADGRRRTKRAS